MEFLCPAIKDNVGVLDIFVITKIRFLKCSVKKNWAENASGAAGWHLKYLSGNCLFVIYNKPGGSAILAGRSVFSEVIIPTYCRDIEIFDQYHYTWTV